MTRTISLLHSLVFFIFNGTVYSQNLGIADSIKKSSVSSVSFPDTIRYQKSSASFYRTDSIFSFRSSKGYFPSLLYDFGEQLTSPFRFKSKEWLITGAVAGITTAFILIDEDIDDWARVQKQKHSWVNKTSPVITKFGGTWSIFPVIATGLLGASLKDKKAVQTSLLASQAFITSGVWVNLIKLLTGRERPLAAYTFSKREGGEWYGPFAIYDESPARRKPVSAFDAFPSGHTASAFSIATVFATQYKDRKAIPVICYSAATLVGLSRLTEHQHWASDVFVGGIIGYLCGKQVVNHYNKTHQNLQKPLSKLKNKSEFTLFQNGNQFGICVVW